MKKLISLILVVLCLTVNIAQAAPKYSNDSAYIYGYNDTTMGANGQALRCEVSSMIYRLVKQNNLLGDFIYDADNPVIYKDTEGTWFRSAVEFMVYREVFSPDVESIKPYEPITRLEAFRLIALGLDFTNKSNLPGKEYTKILKEAAYIQGDENGDLKEGSYITRAEFCTIYNRIINRENAKLKTKDKIEITAETYGFTDLHKDDWYYETMLRATSAYTKNGFVDLELRVERNVLDDYE